MTCVVVVTKMSMMTIGRKKVMIAMTKMTIEMTIGLKKTTVGMTKISLGMTALIWMTQSRRITMMCEAVAIMSGRMA